MRLRKAGFVPGRLRVAGNRSGLTPENRLQADLAQLAEHPICNRKVVGSMPTVSSARPTSPRWIYKEVRRVGGNVHGAGRAGT